MGRRWASARAAMMASFPTSTGGSRSLGEAQRERVQDRQRPVRSACLRPIRRERGARLRRVRARDTRVHRVALATGAGPVREGCSLDAALGSRARGRGPRTIGHLRRRAALPPAGSPVDAIETGRGHEPHGAASADARKTRRVMTSYDEPRAVGGITESRVGAKRSRRCSWCWTFRRETFRVFQSSRASRIARGDISQIIFCFSTHAV